MQYIQSFLSFVFSRQMLAFAAMLMLATVLWFVGPLLAIDGLRPLAGVGVRVSFIVLMLALGILWLVDGPYSMVGVAALCLLVWHAGPLLSLGHTQPLASPDMRAMVIAVILFVYVIYGLLLLRRALRDDKEFLNKILNFGSNAPDDNAAKEELKSVASTANRAMAQLRKLRGHGRMRRLFEGKRYLYELPWYMIVGTPGAGKTTALLNSGLQFPVANQAGHSPRSVLLQTQGGTINCDWWFTNQAVLIDTAGRYTLHDTSDVKDTAEWTGFLGLLRKHRPRAPLNGVIVALDVADLLTMTEVERSEHAATLRERLAELRRELGIRFPVYVIVTKLDLLCGFGEYFQSLTSEARLQAWGFTLPCVDGRRGRRGRRGRWAGAGKRAAAASREALREQIVAEFGLLKDRLADGLRLRLNEEFDVDRRRRLFALPQELAGLMLPLTQVVDEIFLDSRFDDTQWHTSLRGVYFTSGVQTAATMPAEPTTLLQRLRLSLVQTLGVPALRVGAHPSPGQQSFFLQDVLTKVIFPEAHLVRPNLRWEFRFRLLGLLGHSLAIVLFVWLAGALWLSFGNNRQYLEVVDGRAKALDTRVRSLFTDFKPAGVPDTLNDAYQLPGYAGIDLENPPGSFRYGLYSAAPVLEVSTETYARLQDHMLLPTVLRRMEAVLAQSLKNNDAKAAYESLRVYKLLHDRARYMQAGGAADVRNWVLKDWESTDSAAAFGGRATMVGHVQALFSGTRPVQSASLPNEALVRDVQRFLDSNTSTQRIYERAKTAMLNDAPQEFTLVRAVGPQAGTVFSRVGKLPLEKGVPGLFTYDGYHEVFNQRLPEFVGRALEDDAWVMGRGTAGAVKSALTEAADGQGANPLLDDIRRQYLSEYAQHWDDFLNSVRTVGGNDTTGSSLGFDLSVLRQFAAPDSPLTRLARAAARETTLSRPLVTRSLEDKSLFDKAADQLTKQTKDIGRKLGIRQEERLEKQLVDSRFASLREVVTGQPDVGFGAGQGVAMDANGARSGFEGISGLLNEFYTSLVVADAALVANSLPPNGVEIGARLRLEAGKLPAPFREVLTALATSGGDKVLQGSTDILRKQAQLQLDRIMGLMAMQVGEVCKRGVEGRYPFAAVAQDASIEDVTQVFAAGGAADEYFNKYLAPFVDTSVRPWRYKNAASVAATAGMENFAVGAPTTATPAPLVNGPSLVGELLKLLAQNGPNLDAFYRVQQIRELFFREAGGKKMAWKIDVKVVELDPTITDLVIDIDGQGQRYMHGPVQGFTVNWPGMRGGAMAEIIANPRLSSASSTLQVTGPWALFRLLEKGRIVSTATAGRVGVEYSFDGRRALLDVSGGSQPNPLNSDMLKGFHCPGSAA